MGLVWIWRHLPCRIAGPLTGMACMSAHLTLIAVPWDNDARAPRFPGRQRLDLAVAGLPESVRVRLADADLLIHAPEIAVDAAFRAEAAEALSEVDHGRWAGRTMAEVADAEPETFALWRTDMAAAPEDGESLLAARARAGCWLASLERRSGNVVALVSATMARVVLTAALDAPLPLIWRLDVMPWSEVGLTRHRDRWALRLG